MRELQQIVADRVKIAGISRRQVEAACKAVPQVGWERLPLTTTATLDGEPLQRFLDVKVALDLESFVSVYEEFVAGFVLTKTIKGAPRTWLMRNLGLSMDDAKLLFSDGLPAPGRRPSGGRSLLLMTIALAEVARATFNADVVWGSPTAHVVHVDGDYSFGVRDGRPVSNLGSARPKRVHPLRCERGLVHCGRGHVVMGEVSDSTIFSQVAAVAAYQPGLLGEDEGIKLALTILRWHGGLNASGRIAAAISNDVSAEGFRQALHLARGFFAAENPYRHLQDLIVPVYMDAACFREMFGLAPRGRLTPEREMQWRLALDQLAETIDDDY